MDYSGILQSMDAGKNEYSIIFVINLTPISLSLISRDFYSGDGETIFYS